MREIELWLKDSIWGLLLLGVVTSLVATAMWKFTSRKLPRAKLWIALRRWLLRVWLGKRIYAHGYAIGQLSDDIGGSFAYFSFRLARLVIAVASSTLFTTVFLFLINRPDRNLFTAGSYISLVLAMLAAAWAFTEFILFRFFYVKVVQPLLIKGRDDFEKEAAEKLQGILESVKAKSGG